MSGASMSSTVRLNARAEFLFQRLRAFKRTVDDIDAPDIALDQREDNGARTAAGAQHRGGFQTAVPARRGGIEIGEEAFDVGIGRAQRFAIVPQRIGGADRARALVRLRQRKRGLLVRDGDVAADIAVLAQMRDELGEFIRRHRLAPVFGVEIMLLDPIIVDQRRARMRRRTGHDADCLTFFAHASATTLLRNTPICGTSISTTSPGLSHTGCSRPGPSFTGVPVTMISPDLSVMKVLT